MDNNKFFNNYDDDNEITEVDILNQGVAFRRQGKFEEAKNKYIEAIRMNHKNFIGYYNLGKILYILGDYTASVKAYKVAYELGGFEKGIEESILRHLGHSLLDENNKDSMYANVILDYKNSIKSPERFIPKSSFILANGYSRLCIDEAKSYLSRKED